MDPLSAADDEAGKTDSGAAVRKAFAAGLTTAAASREGRTFGEFAEEITHDESGAVTARSCGPPSR
ncbi:hypothetical protein [Streptosporangium sp. NPDC002607]